jgi:hypothetical protein
MLRMRRERGMCPPRITCMILLGVAPEERRVASWGGHVGPSLATPAAGCLGVMGVIVPVRRVGATPPWELPTSWLGLQNAPRGHRRARCT